MFKHQEGAVTGQEVPGLLQAPQLQTVGLLQLDGETHEETQHTSETALAQQAVRHQRLVYIYMHCKIQNISSFILSFIW